MPIDRIQKIPLYETVYKTVKEAILSGELEPGAKLNQTDLAEEMAISRMPVRDALRILETESLIEYRKDVGYVVSAFPEEKIHDTLLIRSILEPEAVMLCRGRITDADIADMDRMLQTSQDALSADDFKKVRALNSDFHFFLYNRAGSSMLLEIINKLWHSYPKNLYRNGDEHERRQLSIDDHRQIVDAIRCDNYNHAAQIMKRHILPDNMQ